MKQHIEVKSDVLTYKNEQTKAQREGRDIGTYPQWKMGQEKAEKFRLELLKQTEKKEDKPKPKRKPRAKKAKE